MGILKNLTKEYFGDIVRKEDEIDIDGLYVEIVKFTDMNGLYHANGFKVKERYPNNELIYPEDKAEILYTLIERIIKVRGNECNLNDIDVSNIHTMCFDSCIGIFHNSDFDGDISGWDMSNVRYTNNMFYNSNFTGKNGIFKITKDCYFCEMIGMFMFSKLNTNIDDWEINKDCDMENMFFDCPLEKNNKLPDWYNIH